LEVASEKTLGVRGGYFKGKYKMPEEEGMFRQKLLVQNPWKKFSPQTESKKLRRGLVSLRIIEKVCSN